MRRSGRWSEPFGSPCPGPAVTTMLAVLGVMATACSAQPKPDLTAMVPMADGTKLATDVYLPKSGGPPWPVRLVRTPYGRVNYNREYGGRTEQGYAIVLQDIRGRFDSQGRDLAFIGCGWNEHQDGVDTLKWILAQPWCDGKVGTEGASAMGITQCLLAAADPPDLAAQYILVAAPSLYHHGCFVSGALRAALVLGWLTGCGFSSDNVWLTVGHPFYDEHWQHFDSIARAERITAPAVHYGGWFDVFLQGTIDGFASRHNRGGPGARGQQKLIIGPWGHGEGHGKPIGELTFPASAGQRPFPCGAQQWFDHYLKGQDTGIEQIPAVQYYTMGAVEEAGAPGNEWRTADNWPVPSTPTAFYFQPDGLLSRRPPDAAERAIAYDYDPLQPVPTRGGCLLMKWKDPGQGGRQVTCGPYDQRDLEQRPDVITFTSEPLTEPIEVTGRLTARLWITSDQVDTDFTAMLCDVYPDGRSMNVADGLARCRYRQGFDRLALLTPGEPTSIEVDLWSTSIVFNQGHRIRVAVSSSNYPRFDVNVNTGWPGWPMGPVQVAHNQVLCNRAHASHIVLPVVER